MHAGHGAAATRGSRRRNRQSSWNTRSWSSDRIRLERASSPAALGWWESWCGFVGASQPRPPSSDGRVSARGTCPVASVGGIDEVPWVACGAQSPPDHGPGVSRQSPAYGEHPQRDQRVYANAVPTAGRRFRRAAALACESELPDRTRSLAGHARAYFLSASR